MSIRIIFMSMVLLELSHRSFTVAWLLDLTCSLKCTLCYSLGDAHILD